MPWFPWPESFKKRACRYLLQYYLGQFFKHRIEVDQLSVDIYKGKGTINDVQLDVEAVNELLETVHAPLEVKRGFIQSVSVVVPWSKLFAENCKLEISGLELTVALKNEGEGLTTTAGSISVGDPMAASMKIAEDCMKEDAEEETSGQYEGVEALAKMIDSVLSRVKVKLADTLVRIEQSQSDNSGIALELHVESLDYTDAAEEQTVSVESSADPSPGNAPTAGSSGSAPIAVAVKNLDLSGVTLSVDEYSQLLPCSSVVGRERQSVFASSDRVSVETSADAEDFLSMYNGERAVQPIPVAQFIGEMKVKVKLKQIESLPGPKMEVLCSLGSLHFFLCPHQLHILLKFFEGLMKDASSVSANAGSSHHERQMQCDDFELVKQQLQTRMQTHQQAAQRERERQKQQKDDPWALPNQSGMSGIEESVDLNSRATAEDKDEFYSLESDLPPLGQPMVDTFESIQLGDRGKAGGRFAVDRQMSAFKSLNSVASTASHGSRSVPSSYSTAVGSCGTPSSQRLASLSHGEAMEELAHYAIELGTLSVVLLESDLQTLSMEGDDSPMRHAAETFFDKLTGILPESCSGLGNITKERLASACAADHIRISLNPFKVNAAVQVSSSCQSTHMELSVGSGEVFECLYGDTEPMPGVQKEQLSPVSITTLIRLSTAESQTSLSEMQSASLKVWLKNTCTTNGHSRCPPSTAATRYPSNSTNTDIGIDLGKLYCELNITLVDRLSDILKPRTKAYRPETQPMPSSAKSLYYSMEPTASVQYQAAYHKAIDEMPTAQSTRVCVSVSCPLLRATVRFPVADLRPAKEKAPWHRQSVRSQSLLLDFSEVKMKTGGHSSCDKTNVDIRFKEMLGYFSMVGEEKPIHFLTIAYTQQDGVSIPRPSLDFPKIMVTIQPNVAIRSELEESPQASLFDNLELLRKSQPSPFSAKNIVYNEEQLVMPGNSTEMKEFEDCAVATSQYLVAVSLPTLNIHMCSKAFYEDLYNRFCSDLLLWEQQSPQEVDHTKYNMEESTQIPLYMCQSALRPEFDDDELDSSDFKSAHPYFVSGNSRAAGDEQLAGQSSRHKQSLLSLTVSIRQGTATIITSAEPDGGNKPPSPEKLVNLSPQSSSPRQSEEHGELLLNLSGSHLFTVIGYQGDADLQYLCLQSESFSLDHVGLMDSEMTVPLVAVDMSSSAATPTMQPTIHSSEPGVAGREEGAPMLSMAMKIGVDKEMNRKDVQLAVSVAGATLRHRVMPPEQTWFTQLSDFFSVSEDLVPGYSPMGVVTSLHTHLCNCAIDYRPLFLSWRAALTLGSFSLSSNIVYTSPQSVLRMILTSVELHLSDKANEKVDLRQDYVCVGDLGSFDLLLKTSSDPEYPSVVLEASNSQLNLWTCADTFVALRDVLVYLASDGDLPQSPQAMQVEPVVSMKLPQSVQKQSYEERRPEEPVQDRLAGEASIDALMASAVEDVLRPDESCSLAGSHGLFSYPLDSDEEDGLLPSELSSAMSDVSGVGHDPELDASLSSFCIVEVPGGKAKASRGSTPQVTCFLEEGDEICVVENHFSVPASKVDLLFPPASYPTPATTYILKELNVAWCLFGGRDFGPKAEEKLSPHSSSDYDMVTANSPQLRRRKGSASGRDDRRKEKGGMCRDRNTLMEIELSKIRVRYDAYPETSDKSARVAALVGNVEVRDRLASSQLNKFLYCYSSESMPKQSHASMVTVKLLCLRSDSPSVSSECCLHVGLLPIKLNVDQDALFFLKGFFEFVQSAPAAVAVSPSGETGLVRSGVTVSRSQSSSVMAASSQSASAGGEIIFKSFTFYPDLPLRIDYHGKRINIEQGFLSGLLTGFAQLSNSEVTLKQLSSKNRWKGFGELVEYAMKEWVDDITGTQLTGILGGVGPMHSLKQLGQGVVDLLWMPIQQYRKDGRVVRGLQKGSSSFGASTAMAAVELTNRLVQTVQAAAEMTYDFVSPAHQSERRQNRAEQKRRYGRQPVDMREGVTRAYDVVAQGVSDTATAIGRVAQHEHEQRGITGAVTGLLKVAPGAAVQPIILATEAMSNVLGGVRNQFVPDARREQEDKYRSEQT